MNVERTVLLLQQSRVDNTFDGSLKESLNHAGLDLIRVQRRNS